MSLGATAAFVIMTLIFSDLFRGLTMVRTIIKYSYSSIQLLTSLQTMLILSTIAHVASYQFMAFMSRAKMSESGAILDSGTDLNMEGGLAEHVKDLVILTTGTQVLAIFSNYFWYLWLLAPARAFHLAWGSVIKPWLDSRNEQKQQPELDEKKQKKLDRKMRRMR